MAVKQMRTAAPAAPAAQPGKFDPATWAGQARTLARNQADATAMQAALALTAGGAVAVALLVGALGWPWRRLATGGALAVVGAALLAVAVVWLLTYARTLARDTHAVRMATWRQEMESGLDLDGDGMVGPPEPVGHVVRIGGARPAAVVLPDMDAPRAQPPLAGFPVCANDVIYILQRGARQGLSFRTWQAERLPSGAQVERRLWAAVLDGLVEWQFGIATIDGGGRRYVELRSDVDTEVMVSAVQRGLAGAE